MPEVNAFPYSFASMRWMTAEDICNNGEVQFSLNTYLDEPCVDILDVDDHIRLGVSQASNI